jgi:GT2 family glycosyltransferase
MVRFSVIIPNYNGYQYLPSCLDSILVQTCTDFEIIVVDNASTDGSVKFVCDTYPNVNIIRNTINRGFAGGCNDGARIASGEYLLFLNTDTVLPSYFLSLLYEGVCKYPGYGMYAPKMVYPDGRINSTGICISLSGAAWDRGMGEYDYGQYDHSEEVFGPCGGAALYRSDVFLESGGFDDDFFLFMEDVDLAFRVQLAGWKCRYIPNAMIFHYHGGTAGVGSDVAVYYGNRNILWYPVKNFPWWLFVIALPWIIGRTVGVIGYYAMKGKGRVVLRSKWDGVTGMIGMIRKRRGISHTLEFIRIIHFLKVRINTK